MKSIGTKIKADLRAGQLDSSRDTEKTFKIAYELVKAKIQRSKDVLRWLGERYEIQDKIRKVGKESLKLSKTKTLKDLRTVEGRVALRYWQTIQSIIPETFDFQTRITKSHQFNASDPVNLALNYAYGVLKGECLRAINTIGLETSVGFLHETANYQTKQSLVYDLQEPFIWIADISVLEAFESGILDMKDFYFTADDYRYRFNVDAKKRFLELLQERFNSGVNYKSKNWKWDTIILNKTQELARFLLGKSKNLDFSEPNPVIKRTDSLKIRAMILKLTQKQARERKISKSTLHYLRKNAKNEKPFRVYRKIFNKI